MKKRFKALIISGMVLAMGAMVYADAASTPAQIYADITGKTIEEVYELRGQGKSFGQLAIENELGEEYQAKMLEAKKHTLADMVANNEITQERADEIIKAMEENCDGTGTQRIGQKLGLGKGAGQGRGRGNGAGMGKGMRNGTGRGQGMGLGNI